MAILLSGKSSWYINERWLATTKGMLCWMKKLVCFTSDHNTWRLTLSRRRSLSYRNQFIDLLCKSMDWFLLDNGLRFERVKVRIITLTGWKWNFPCHFDCFLILLMDCPFAVFLYIIYSHVSTGNWLLAWRTVKRMWIIISSPNRNTFCPRISELNFVHYFGFPRSWLPRRRHTETWTTSEFIEFFNCVMHIDISQLRKIHRFLLN